MALFFCGAVFVPGSEAAAFAKSAAQGSPATASSTYQAIAAVPPTGEGSRTTGGRYLIEDRLSHTALWVTLGFAVMLAVAACDGGSPRIGHRFAILALSLAGVVSAVLANDLILAVFAMELAALPATVLLFVERDMPNSRAAALRSLSLNLFALAMLVAGAAMIGLLSGTTNLGELRSAIPPALVSRRVTLHGHIAARRRDRLCPDSRRLGCPSVCRPLPARVRRNLRWHQTVGNLADGIVAARRHALLLLVRLLVQGPLHFQVRYKHSLRPSDS